MSLGKRILAARQDLLLTQRELADRLDVTTQSISRWERDEAVPGWRSIRRLAEVTGRSPSYFLIEEKVA